MEGWASAPSHTAPSHAHCRALFAFKIGQAAGIGRRQRPGRFRHDGCGTKAKRQAMEESGSVVDGGPLDILARDLQFLHDRTGVDLITPLTPVKDAHDQVVAVLNPIAGEKLARCMEDDIAGLQLELETAHREVHAMEQQLTDTICSLSELEEVARRLNLDVPETPDPPLALSDFLDEELPSTSGRVEEVQLPPAASGRQARQRLQSGLGIPQGLQDFWFPAEFSSSLAIGRPVALTLFDQAWVLFRGEDGEVACLRDACAHRACPLSAGKVVGKCIQCPYHGWEYNAQGECTAMPSTRFVRNVGVESLEVQEAEGFVWVWTGHSEPGDFSGVAALVQPPPGFQVHAELLLEVPVEHGLLLENLLDLAHAPFTHTSTFAKGWPIPEAVRFNARKVLAGNWEPYPIDMSFEPPCMVLSTIGLAQPGKIERGMRAERCKNHLHQLHVCLPVGPGRTRLLYRMSMDFMAWSKWIPGITHFWRAIANQVMGEDLVLVAGQQARMVAGADVWANPVSYDKLGVRYRRWRNSLEADDAAEQEAALADLRPMAAGEVFSLEEPEP